ncbi:hypothetical protein [Nonomuraea roseola]|uniref:Uncharacterized protein n=1 Tax=Nonomuraea roseola TaxID=46179 RepID=A0ABV5QB08_9ACTN
MDEHLVGRVRALDAAWQLMAERLEEAGQDAKLSFEVQPGGRLKLNVDRIGALGESKSLRWPSVMQKRLARIYGHGTSAVWHG